MHRISYSSKIYAPVDKFKKALDAVCILCVDLLALLSAMGKLIRFEIIVKLVWQSLQT